MPRDGTEVNEHPAGHILKEEKKKNHEPGSHWQSKQKGDQSEGGGGG